MGAFIGTSPGITSETDPAASAALAAHISNATPHGASTAGMDLLRAANASAQLGLLGSGTPGVGNFLRGDGSWSPLGSIRSTGAAFDLRMASSEALTANRTLSWVLGDAARTIALGGDISTADAFSTAGANALTLTTTAATNVTLPTSGTLATLGANTFTGNQTLGGNAAVFNGSSIISDGANVLALRNGTAAQKQRWYNSFTDASNGAWFEVDLNTASTAILRGNGNGTGASTISKLQIGIGGTANVLDYAVTVANTWSFAGDIRVHGNVWCVNYLRWTSGKAKIAGSVSSTIAGALTILDEAGGGAAAVQLGGDGAAFPMIKREGTTTTASCKLGDNSAFAPFKAKLTTDTAYAAGTVVATGYLTLYDGTGTAYRVPCAV